PVNYEHPVAGQHGTFSIIAGGGAVSATTKSTGLDGVARTSWTVGNAGTQTLRATAGSLNVDVNANAVSCSEITLAIGEVQQLTPANASCAVLNGKAKRYFVTIVNATNSPVASVAYKGRGFSGATSSASVQPVTTTTVAPTTEAVARMHGEILEKNMELLQRFGPQAQAAMRSSNKLMAQSAPPAVGDLIPMKLPDITVNGCTVFSNVVGRVVYVGSKAIMLEDTTT